MVDLCGFLGINHNTTSSYHPQTNSQAETYNKTMIQYLASWFGLVWFFISNTLASLAGYIHYIHNPAEKKDVSPGGGTYSGRYPPDRATNCRLCHKASANSAIN